MSSQPEVIVHADANVLAAAVAARLINRLVDAQMTRGTANVVLTGGGVGISALHALRQSPAKDAVNWDALDIWWGDERYVEATSSERNDKQAQEALLDALPINPKRVHSMPADDGITTPEIAAERYNAELVNHAAAGQLLPQFDVLLLGLGAEGHIASIFPESPAIHAEGNVVAVRDCPKPPPRRISLTFSAIQSAKEVWIIAAGAQKATPLELALAGASQVQIPVAGALGKVRTLWLLDHPAASQLPPVVHTPF